MKIAIDFDGTIVTHEYPAIGKDIGAVPIIKRMIESGHEIILHTMRAGKEETEALEWLKNRGIQVAGVNYSPGQEKWTKSKKVYANLYIDDAALGIPLKYNPVLCLRPFVDWEKVENLLIDRKII